MYNRYVPQSDGSYRRSRLEEQRQQPKRQENRQKPSPQPPISEEHLPQPEAHPHNNQQIGGFFKQLLPPGFDSGDLIIVLLLLLMAGDCEEDRSTALLTLALYFVM